MSPHQTTTTTTTAGEKNAPEHDLPPIELDSSSTELQLRIYEQSWKKVSARHPPGSKENPPDRETLAEFSSTILERRLADVVRHRREAKLADKSFSSSLSANGGGGGSGAILKGGKATLKSSSQLSLSLLHNNCDRILLTSRCRSQLRKFVKHIASMYHDNKYHGLEHAVHVTMSANKLLEMLHDGSVESLDSSNEDFMASEPYLKAQQSEDDSGSFMRNGSKFSTSAAAVSSSTSHSAAADQHSHTYSDTFAKFAFVFASFIHDVDHQGVPNARLVAENDPICNIYGRISVAEKHSIKVAFRTLNESDYDEFRSTVYETNEDKLRLHRIIHSLVLSTDIASPERMRETKKRWHEAFSRPVPEHGPLAFSRLSLAGKYTSTKEIATVQASKLQLVACDVDNTRKEGKYEARGELFKKRNSMTRTLQMDGGQTVEYFASSSDEDDIKIALRHSVMLETMLNVADVAHAMQSWELFCFWNRKLYEELYSAFKAGRSDNDPSAEWYQNELDFFRLYIIPLSEKMKKSGMFGDRGEEWINNALRIRDRWKSEGKQVTQEMIDAVRTDYE
ncbi:hypothetical protein ACHAXM_001958 [Skeletonema potamos]|jgi:hypothetical protein